MQACRLLASAIILNMTAEYNKQRLGDFKNDLMACFQIHLLSTGEWTLSCCITCMSAVLVLPLFLWENNFHSRPHRKVAMRHTLPNIQISLSLRKFSMMETFLFLSLLSACTGCLSYLSLSATCGKGVLGGGQQVVDIG